MNLRRAAAVVLVVAGGIAAVHAVRAGSRVLRAREVCAAVEAAKWEQALAVEFPAGGFGSEEARLAAECRCDALYATDRGADCVALVGEALFSAEAGDWVPSRALTQRLVEDLAEAGEVERATALLERAEWPDAETVGLRASLARHWLRSRSPERAAAVLGEAPAPGAGARDRWFRAAVEAAASAGERARLEALVATWRADPASRARAGAWAALLRDVHQLFEAGEAREALAAAIAEEDAVGDPELMEMIYYRAIGGLAVTGEIEAARALLAQARARGHVLASIDVDDLARGSAVVPASGEGVVRFSGLSAGSSLFLSPADPLPPDTDFESVPMRDGAAGVRRVAGSVPLRWVARDAEGATVGSGLAWVRAGEKQEVGIVAKERRIPDVAAPLARLPADGARRVLLIVVDCMDWRVLGHLRARGELPAIGGLISAGWRAVLTQSPALTAAAMDALVHPVPPATVTMPEIVRQLGIEAAGLESVGRNPVEPLAALLPERADLFGTIGATSWTTANLLFAHGDISAGRNALVVGPNGRSREIPLPRMTRELRPDEIAALTEPEAFAPGSYSGGLIGTVAAQFDLLDRYAADVEIGLVALRVEAFDILTHAHFGAAARAGQDDGRGALYDVYRYADRRLGGFAAALDADDTLIVMSDHGIRTSMRHDENAVLVMVGPGVPVGRAPDAPALRGVGRVLAALTGVDVAWPDTGIAPWLTGEGPSTLSTPGDSTLLEEFRASVKQQGGHLE